MKTTDPAGGAWLAVEAAVEAFETAYLAAGGADPAAFCPPPADPLHVPVAAELVRAAMEFDAQAGLAPRLDAYAAAFPALFADPAALAAVAFEELRLRRRAGDSALTDEYRARYGLTPPPPPTTGLTRILADFPAHARSAAAGLAMEAGRFPEPGERVAGFRLVRELGRGAFARVYLAEQTDLAGRFVALKLSTVLVTEAQTLARLQHSNIVPVYSVHPVGRFHVVCMPYLGSATLADVLARMRVGGSVPTTAAGILSTLAERKAGSSAPGAAADPLPPTPPTAALLDGLSDKSHVEAVLWIAAELAAGLAHAHDRGVVHRDVKPANVLLTDDGRPMLLDFNLALDARAAAAGPAGGTLSHMAPELLGSLIGTDVPAGPAADVYALGLIVYELLTGRPAHPLPAGTHREQVDHLRVLRSAPPPPAAAVNPAVTPAVDAILAKCLARYPADRYASAHDLRDDILRHLADRPLRHVREPSARERARKFVRRNPWVRSVPFLGGLFALVAGVGVAGYVVRTRQLDAADAQATLRDFRTDADAAKLRLALFDPAPPDRDAAAAAAQAALARYVAPDAPDWERSARFTRLDDAARTEVRAAAGELYVHLARMAVLRAAAADGDARAAALADALEWCDRAERTSPDDAGRATARWFRGEITELAAGRREGNFLARLRTPTGPVPWRVAVETALDRGDFRAALERLRAVDPAETRRPEYWMYLGHAHDAAGDLADAAAAYTAGLALQPAGDGFYHGRGNVRLKLKDYRGAAADFDHALRLRPDDALLLRERGQARLLLGDYPAALADLNRAEERDPGHTRVYFMRAQVHARAGDKAAARAQTEEGLKRTPGDAVSWVTRGVARQPRDPAGALADYDQALARNPRLRVALQNKASVLSERLGKPAEAVAVLDELIEHHPQNAAGRAGRAVLHARLGNRAAAHADAAAALKLDAAPFTRYQLAGVYALTSKSHPADAAEALRLLASALRDKEGLGYVATDSDLDPIRADPAFARLVDAARALEAAAGRN